MLSRMVKDMQGSGATFVLGADKLAADEMSLPLAIHLVEARCSAGLRSAIEATQSAFTRAMTKQSSPSKILQTVHKNACLLELADWSFVRIDWGDPVPLQILCNTRAPVYYAASTNSALKLGLVAKNFPQRRRPCRCMVCHLGDRVQYPQGEQRHHIDHATRGAPYRECDPLAAFAQQHVNSMRLFRDALRTVVN